MNSYSIQTIRANFTPMTGNLNNTNSFRVGASPLDGYLGIGGIDEVEVYSRALQASEIQSIFSAGSYGKCKPCCYLKVLTISKVTSTTVEVNWGGCGVLEEASSVLGPWTPLPNATSPYVIPATGLEMFYRLECQ